MKSVEIYKKEIDINLPHIFLYKNRYYHLFYFYTKRKIRIEYNTYLEYYPYEESSVIKFNVLLNEHFHVSLHHILLKLKFVYKVLDIYF